MTGLFLRNGQVMVLEVTALADEDRDTTALTEEVVEDIERLKKHLDMLDQRLDNIDSMVTAIAERVMSQPISLNIVCPHCNRNLEIAIIGKEKPTR
jgi:hypothetical protein